MTDLTDKDYKEFFDKLSKFYDQVVPSFLRDVKHTDEKENDFMKNEEKILKFVEDHIKIYEKSAGTSEGVVKSCYQERLIALMQVKAMIMDLDR